MEPTRIIDNADEMRGWARAMSRSGRSIALVPTMGALHAGHMALIAAAHDLADLVVVSIFVNPLQFGDAGDLDRYPRPLEADLAACSNADVHLVYSPTVATMYPVGFDTRVVPGRLADAMEGTSRPGHFEGVATVVTKLFAAVLPDLAVFGEKDYQQLVIIRRMVTDLDLGVDVVAAPTVRETDGLALSSRNQRLSPRQREAAKVVPRAMTCAREVARHADSTIATIVEAASRVVAAEPLASLDYATVFDATTLEPVLDLGRRTPGRTRLALAVRFGDVRLIDNVDLFADVGADVHPVASGAH